MRRLIEIEFYHRQCGGLHSPAPFRKTRAVRPDTATLRAALWMEHNGKPGETAVVYNTGDGKLIAEITVTTRGIRTFRFL